MSTNVIRAQQIGHTAPPDDGAPARDWILGKKNIAAGLSDPSVFQYGYRAAAEWISIVACLMTAHYLQSILAYVAGAYVIGIFQHRLSVLGHEGSHRHISKTPWLNDLISNLTAWWPLVLSSEAFRAQHLDHHSFLATPKDPENWYEAWHGTFGLPRRKAWFLQRVLMIFVGFGLKSVMRAAWAYQPRSMKDAAQRVLFWAAVSGGLWASGNSWVLGMWFGAYLTTFWAASWMRWWSEHQGTDGTNRIVAPLWQRLTIYPHNTWCHFEHHQWPTVPSWNLPKLRARYSGTEPFVRLTDLFVLWEQSAPIAGGVARRPSTSGAKNRYTVTPPGMSLPT